MVHCISQALADEQEHALVDTTSSRDTCFLSYCRTSQLESLYTRVPIKITPVKCFGVAGGSSCLPAIRAPPDLLLNRS